MSYYINEYRIEDKLQNKNSGFSKWGFCFKDGKQYFIKEFLHPIYPEVAAGKATMSERQVQRKKKECLEFENRLSEIFKTVNECSDGNIVRIQQFFREGSKYYIVTDKINSNINTIDDVAALYNIEKMFVCKLIAHSVLHLHNKQFVHADIKPTNILITRTEKICTAKLIDFDCGFFEKNPPEIGEELYGDPVYFAPESLRFLAEEDVRLNCKIDVFALGLLFHQYMTGKLPYFDSTKYAYAAEAVLDGGKLVISGEMPNSFAELLKNMLCENPDERISIRDVYDSILPSGKSRSTVEETGVLNKPKFKVYNGNKTNISGVAGPKAQIRAENENKKLFAPGDLP